MPRNTELYDLSLDIFVGVKWKRLKWAVHVIWAWRKGYQFYGRASLYKKLEASSDFIEFYSGPPKFVSRVIDIPASYSGGPGFWFLSLRHIILSCDFRGFSPGKCCVSNFKPDTTASLHMLFISWLAAIFVLDCAVLPWPATSQLTNFWIYDPVTLTPIRLSRQFFLTWRLEFPTSDLEQLLQKVQDHSDHSSVALSQAESHSNSPITRAFLSESGKGLEIPDFVIMLNCL